MMVSAHLRGRQLLQDVLRGDMGVARMEGAELGVGVQTTAKHGLEVAGIVCLLLETFSSGYRCSYRMYSQPDGAG